MLAVIISAIIRAIAAKYQRQREAEMQGDELQELNPMQQPRKIKRKPRVRTLREEYYPNEYADNLKAKTTLDNEIKPAEVQDEKLSEQGSGVDFDLRQAVIASEILKPKFED